MSSRLALLLPVGALLFGLALGMPRTTDSSAPSVALESAEMQYYLMNQAFYAGDVDSAVEKWTALQSSHGSESLCPGVGIFVSVRSETLELCNIERLQVPQAIETWMDQSLESAQVAMAQGDSSRADQLIDEVVQVDPYRLSTYEFVATLYALNGDAAKEKSHRTQVQALRQGRVQAVEWVKGRQL